MDDELMAADRDFLIEEKIRLERENAKLRELVVNLRTYGHLLLKGERPIAALSDVLPLVLADADAVKL